MANHWKLHGHLRKRGYKWETFNCNCNNRFSKSYEEGKGTVTIRHGIDPHQRKRSLRQPIQIEYFVKSQHVETVRMPTTARGFDDWLEKHGLLNAI